jgi:hypothetical protein
MQRPAPGNFLGQPANDLFILTDCDGSGAEGVHGMSDVAGEAAALRRWLFDAVLPLWWQIGADGVIKFLSKAGGLVIEDSPNNVSAFTGTVSGFGGANHTNHKQFMDLGSVTSAPGQAKRSSFPRSGQSWGTV